MKYYVYQRGRLFGPLPVEKIPDIPGFSGRTLVSPEELGGGFREAWRRAALVPELRNTIPMTAPALQRRPVLRRLAVAAPPLPPAPAQAPATDGAATRLENLERLYRELAEELRALREPRRRVVIAPAPAGPSGAEAQLCPASPGLRGAGPSGAEAPADLPAPPPPAPEAIAAVPPAVLIVPDEVSASGAVEAPSAEVPEIPAAVSLAPSGPAVSIPGVAAPGAGVSTIPDSDTEDVVSPREWVLIGLSGLATMVYLAWRWTSTLNYSSPINTAVSMTLYFSEVFGFISLVFFFLQTHRRRFRGRAPVPDEDSMPTVDVMVPIYDEPAEILYKTLVGCRALDYPKSKLSIFVLDDGNRPEIKRVARSLDCLYLTREGNEGAKAGNLNAALPNTKGEVLLILDCDHIPVSSLLTETIGFFEEEGVAFVQMPHHFYNPDCFQRNLHLEGELAHEQDLFFRVIMPGRDAHNSAIFAGSSILMRRDALESIGGCRTQCAIEDLHTGMELHARGWRSVYYPRVLSGALSPESFKGLLLQRARWTRGGVQMFVKENPLFKSGLTMMQRLHYFASILYFLHSIPRVIFLLAPLAFLLFNLNPIVASTWVLVLYFLPHYVLSYLAFTAVSRGYRNPFWSDAYEAATAYALSWTVIQTLLRPDRLIFNVTPKGEAGEDDGERLNWSFVLPHLITMGLLFCGVVVATLRFSSGRMGIDSYALSGYWAAFNLILLGAAVEVARERPKKRDSHRLRRSLRVDMHAGGKAYHGKTVNLSESGVGLTLRGRYHLPPKVWLAIHGDSGEICELEGTVMRNDWSLFSGSNVGVRFDNLSVPLKRSLMRLIYTSPHTWSGEAPKGVHFVSAARQIAGSVLRTRLRRADFRKRRAWPRIPVDFPCTLEAGETVVSARAIDMSATGVCVSVPCGTHVPDHASLSFVGGRDQHYEVEVKLRRLHPRAGRPPWWKFWAAEPPKPSVDLYGLHFINPSHLDLSVAAERFVTETSEVKDA